MVSSATIRDRLGHPVVDGDGHWNEPIPVFLDFLRDEAGPRALRAFESLAQEQESWYRITREGRLSLRKRRGAFWGEPAKTEDFATAMLPGLLYERLGEFGIDFSIIYPTLGLVLGGLRDDGLRRAGCRALNKMTTELFRSLRLPTLLDCIHL